MERELYLKEKEILSIVKDRACYCSEGSIYPHSIKTCKFFGIMKVQNLIDYLIKLQKDYIKALPKSEDKE